MTDDVVYRASDSSAEVKLQMRAGSLASVTILPPRHPFGRLYCVTCRACDYKTLRLSSRRAALDAWAIHLDRKHPGMQAPCLGQLQAAYKGRADRRAHREERNEQLQASRHAEEVREARERLPQLQQAVDELPADHPWMPSRQHRLKQALAVLAETDG